MNTAVPVQDIIDVCERAPGYIRSIAPYQPGKPISELARAPAGTCFSAQQASSGAGIGCAETASPALGGELTCTCLQDGFLKPGNNGTVSCTEYCGGSSWGPVGECLDAHRADNAAQVGCGDVTNTPTSCYCAGWNNL